MPCSHWSPIWLVPHCHPLYPVLIGPPSHWSPNVTLSTLFSLVPHLIGPPMQPWLYSSHWSPISLVPQCNPGYTVLIGPPSHWSPPVTFPSLLSLVSLVFQCNPGYTVLIGSPSHWSPSLTPSTLFSLVPHLIGPPMWPWLHSSHWSPISLVPQCNPGYTVLIGSPSHWSPSLTPSTLFSLVPHLIGPPMWPWLHSSHWSPISLVPNATLITQFSLVPHLIGPPV